MNVTNEPITDYAAALEGGGITSAYLRANTKIRGWTSLMLFGVLLGSLFSLIYPIVTFFQNPSHAMNPFFGYLDILLGAVTCVTGLIASVGLFRRLPGAVFWLRFYFVICFATNLISVVCSGMEELSAFEAKTTVRGIVWSVIWFIYTFRSKQLEEVLPKRFRKASGGEIVLAAVLALAPVACFAMGYYTMYRRAEQWSVADIRQADLPDGTFTDGHIIAAKLENAIIQTPPDGEVGTCVLNRQGSYCLFVASMLFGDDGDATFESVRQESRNEEFGQMRETEVTDETRQINGRKARVKVVRLTGDKAEDESYHWRFAILYDPETHKAAILSGYDGLTDASYFDELLTSIRFKNEE